MRNFMMTTLVLLVTAAAVGCGDDSAIKDDDAGAEAAPKPVYAMMTQVYGTNDDRTVYVSLTDSVDIDAVDLESAREFPGVANLAAVGGKLLVSSGQAPSITEFDIGENLEWKEGRTLSFASFPFEDNANLYYHYIVDDHTAYLPFEVSKRVIWDPSKMEIVEVLDDSELVLKQGTLSLDSGGNRNGIRYAGPVLQPFYYHDDDWLQHGDESLVAIYDQKTHAESSIVSLPCPGLSMTTQDEDGYTYFAPWAYTGALALYGAGSKPCVARLKPDNTLDAAWTTDLTDQTDGHYVNNYRYIGNGKAVGNVLMHEELDIDWSAGYDPDNDDAIWASGPHWRFWMFDVKASKAWPVEGIDVDISSGAQFAVLDGRTFVFLPFDEWSKTAVYELDDAGVATKRFEVLGDVFKWVRVR